MTAMDGGDPGYEATVGACLQANGLPGSKIRLQASSHSGFVALSELVFPAPADMALQKFTSQSLRLS